MDGEKLTTQAATFDPDHNVQHIVVVGWSDHHHLVDIYMFINCDHLSQAGVSTTHHILAAQIMSASTSSECGFICQETQRTAAI